MWSSLTLGRGGKDKDKARDDTVREAADKATDTVNKKLARAQTFCYDSHYSDQNAKKGWLKNLPNVRKKFSKNKSEKKCRDKVEKYSSHAPGQVKEIPVFNFVPDKLRKPDTDRKDKESCGPGLSEKVSRRAILDKSLSCPVVVDEEDIWFSTSKLFLDHINEIHSKWEAIEDDIWAKVIVMERNRRVAKAYVRSPTITIGGGPEGFDGLRIGLEGFGNPLRDEETERVKKKIGVQACKIRMEEDGNVLIKRTGKTEVSVLAAADTGDRRQADRLGRNQGHLLETDKTVALFDMNKFQRNMAESMRYGQRHRDRREMELQCVSTVGFVPGQAGQAGQVLDQPCWIIVINMVTLDLLRSSMAHDPGIYSHMFVIWVFRLMFSHDPPPSYGHKVSPTALSSSGC